jgi:hypothetical protein
MRAINHALTGAIIGLTVTEPLAAVPAAILSHYICDAIPHYGPATSKTHEVKTRMFRDLLYADIMLCFGLVIILTMLRPQHWLLAIVCATAAAAPDGLSFNNYFKVRRGLKWQPGRYVKFAWAIQWFERPIGAVVEVAWFAGAVILLVPFLR